MNHEILAQKYSNALDFLYAPIKSWIKYDLEMMKALVEKLGAPQNSFKSIHIAGTSGKGSTATLLTSLLHSHGFKVGTTVSPHILDIRERIQINGNPISKELFVKYFDEIKPIIESINKQKNRDLSFFEMITGLAFYVFAQEKVDYGVIEVGLGGTLCATNTINRPDKVCIITKIGLDHTDILGKTIKEIAGQKAGIIQNGQEVITCRQNKHALQVIQEKCEQTHSHLTIVNNHNALLHKNIKLAMVGDFQTENASLALKALQILSSRDNFVIHDEIIVGTLENTTFLGRFNIIRVGQRHLIVDGAHNPQKMKAFIKSLINRFPNRKFNFYIAFKNTKDYRSMLKAIIPYANCIYISNFVIEKMDTKGKSVEPEDIKEALENLGFLNIKIIAKKEIYKQIVESDKDCVLTGSLYFVSDFYLLNTFLHNNLDKKLTR